jgi:hypothetical protein
MAQPQYRLGNGFRPKAATPRTDRGQNRWRRTMVDAAPSTGSAVGLWLTPDASSLPGVLVVGRLFADVVVAWCRAEDGPWSDAGSEVRGPMLPLRGSSRSAPVHVSQRRGGE